RVDALADDGCGRDRRGDLARRDRDERAALASVPPGAARRGRRGRRESLGRQVLPRRCARLARARVRSAGRPLRRTCIAFRGGSRDPEALLERRTLLVYWTLL